MAILRQSTPPHAPRGGDGKWSPSQKICTTLPYTPAKFQKNPFMFEEILSLKTFPHGEKWSNVPAQSRGARGARLG